MQKRYLWLAGSYPARILVQGQGKRSRKLRYELYGDDELVVFGYSNPPEWLVRRDLLRPLQARHSYALTGAGEMILEQLHAKGGISSDEFEEVRVRPTETEG